ncbi:hypothetical protein [Haloarchaeobius sp. HRN-SO-5]|uniref:hypothetical protein n=1 Tax=Haloarchaeobius sp. HRN-SO-5 TaxID=3446118 RepID=UPI003EBB587D
MTTRDSNATEQTTRRTATTDAPRVGDGLPTALTAVDSPRAKLVYLYLDAVGEASPSRLCADLDVQKLSLLSVLRTLESHGLVERRDDGRVGAVTQ